MNRSSNSTASSGILGRYTPDTRRWRVRVAGLAAIAAPLAFYASFAVASGVKSGLVYNLLILLFGILTLILPVIGAVSLLAPNSGISRADSSSNDDAVAMLKRRYAAGEIDQAEFDRRLDDLMETTTDTPQRQAKNQRTDHSVTERELDRVS